MIISHRILNNVAPVVAWDCKVNYRLIMYWCARPQLHNIIAPQPCERNRAPPAAVVTEGPAGMVSFTEFPISVRWNFSPLKENALGLFCSVYCFFPKQKRKKEAALFLSFFGPYEIEMVWGQEFF